MPKVKIGIVGCGAIGSSLAKAIARDFKDKAEVAALFDIDNTKADNLSRLLKKRAVCKGLDELIRKSDLVIEAASAKVSFNIAQKVLSRGRSVMIMSVGGILSGFSQLKKTAARKNLKIYIPSGAISGVDALKAAAIGRIKEVTLTTTKNPKSFGRDFDREGVLFSGSAKVAVKRFPQNINVAAVLSLAGIGENKTRIKIVSSKKTERNIHEINVAGESGNIYTRTENVLHPDNPKTSFLAVLSAIAVLKQILESVKIGS